jgi:oligopeptidase A
LYKWAEVLSADAYSLFEELGVLSAAAGCPFSGRVLALAEAGGDRSFVAFPWSSAATRCASAA